MDTTRLIAPGLFAVAIVGDYVCHKAGLPTASSELRKTAHTESLAGKVIVAGGWTALSVWVVPHWIAPHKQHHVVH